MPRFHSVTHVLAAVVLSACSGKAAARSVNDSTFVATMAHLQVISADPSLDSATRSERRRAVLQDQGLTSEDLERAASALADEPERAVNIWTAIDRRIAELTSDTAR
ncbi:MAG: hypothetical protein ABR543_12965 [Gemmatimonadaceae bacterium]